MHHAAVPIALHRESHMKHLVEQQVFNQVGRSCRRVQRSVDDNHPMASIVMAKDGPRILKAPAQAGQGKLAIEELLVQTLKYLPQIVPAATGRKQAFRAALAPRLVDAVANAGA
jgi:hypothetical protein